MSSKPENKSIELTTDYANHSINMKFSDNLTDDRERGYRFVLHKDWTSKQLLKWLLHIMINLQETTAHHYLSDYNIF